MDSLWSDFCISPANYLSSRKLSSEAFVNDVLQTLSSEECVNSKLVALGILQDKAEILFTDSEGVVRTVYSLINTFVQQKNTGAPLISSQILCTITTMVIEVDPLLRSHEHLLIELVGLLFDTIEKVKTDSNRLLKSTACDCLRELEVAFPGLLCSKVGHFFGMSQAESSYMHQNYMALFSTVLEHTIQMFVLDHGENSSSNGVEQTLSDLLSYSDPLKSFVLPENLFERADRVLGMHFSDSMVLDEGVDVHEVKKGVSFLLEHCPLMTPPCLAYVVHQLISCVHSSALAPKMLKSVMLQYSSSFNVQLFYLVLQLKLRFGADICDEGDEEDLISRFQALACHPCMPTYQKCLLFQWMLCWQNESEPKDQESESTPVETPSLLQPTVFDPLEVVYNKLKMLSLKSYEELNDETFQVKDLLVSVLKLVGYGIVGDPAITLYRLLFNYYTSPHGSSLGNEISRLLLDIATRQSAFIPHTIDFLQSVEKLGLDSSFLVTVLVEVSQTLLTRDMKCLLDDLPLQLSVLNYTARHTQITPKVVLRILARLLREGQVCDRGSWETGTAILDICNTLMRHHKTSAILKELSDLLQLMARGYNDIDIQDRARFYHQLVLTVSGSKLSAILTLASDTAAGSSLSDIVEARISNAMFPSAPPLQRIPDKFLTLTRIHQEFGSCYASTGEETVAEDEDMALNSYLQAISEETSIPVRLQYRINFSTVPDMVSQRIYALVLKIQNSGPYQPSPDVYVPCLAVEVTPGTPSTSKVVTLTFYPKEPVPQTFSISAVFTTEDGLSCVTDVSPVKLEFEDLFQPVPKSIRGMVPPAQLFSILWNYIQDTQHDYQEGTASDTHCAAMSVAHLGDGTKTWEQCMEGLKGLRVFHGEHTGEEHTLVFVPPRFHFLCRFHPPSRLLLAMDNWKMLPLINCFIQA